MAAGSDVFEAEMCSSRKVCCDQLAMSPMDAGKQRRGLCAIFLAISDLVKCSPFTDGETERGTESGGILFIPSPVPG